MGSQNRSSAPADRSGELGYCPSSIRNFLLVRVMVF
jgi:hypothetical protein